MKLDSVVRLNWRNMDACTLVVDGLRLVQYQAL